MDRLIEYVGHHPLLAAVTAAALALVIAYELYLHRQSSVGVSPQDLIRLMNQGAVVLDVRPQVEFEAGHIGGARRFASEELGKAADTLKRYREKPLVVYCEAGAAGASAVRQLAAQGFTKVASLKGGLAAWRAENLPLVKG